MGEGRGRRGWRDTHAETLFARAATFTPSQVKLISEELCFSRAPQNVWRSWSRLCFTSQLVSARSCHISASDPLTFRPPARACRRDVSLTPPRSSLSCVYKPCCWRQTQPSSAFTSCCQESTEYLMAGICLDRRHKEAATCRLCSARPAAHITFGLVCSVSLVLALAAGG